MKTMLLLVLVVAWMPFPAFSAAGVARGGASVQTRGQAAIIDGATAFADVSSAFGNIVTNRNVPGVMGLRLDTDTLSAAGVAGVHNRQKMSIA